MTLAWLQPQLWLVAVTKAVARVEGSVDAAPWED